MEIIFYLLPHYLPRTQNSVTTQCLVKLNYNIIWSYLKKAILQTKSKE